MNSLRGLIPNQIPEKKIGTGRFSEKTKDKWFSITYSNQSFLRKAVKNKYK